MAKANPPISDADFFQKMATDDSLHIIIEGTIIIESELRAIIGLLLLRPLALDEAGLDYSQQVSLAFAMGIDDKLVKPLRTLGSIRNNYAHKMMPEIDTNMVNNLLQAMHERERNMVKDRYKELRAANQRDAANLLPPFAELEAPLKFVMCIIVLRAALIISKRALLKEIPTSN